MTGSRDAFWKRLRAEYNIAFRNWKAEVTAWQSLSSQVPPDREAIQLAGDKVQRAAAIYRAKRDSLAESVIGQQTQSAGSLRAAAAVASGGPPMPYNPAERGVQVRELAHRIWEETGRPSGSAEDNWHQAEQILIPRR